ncbi:MAG: transporter substrate-binding domain-containing protein [Sulfurospirillaceae bacterium]|nr:transporter substrate-binding domain-containing protein [Sulfurospirillaceae bacterium]
MKRAWLFLFLFLALLTSLKADHIQITPQEQAWLDKNKTLRVRISKELMPYQRFENGKAEGISVEYMTYFANIFNLKIEYISDIAWSEALQRIEAHNGIDILLKATVNKERSDKMLFSDPYIAFPFALATSKDYPYADLLESQNYTIALAKSYVINDKLKQDYPRFTYRVFETNLDALKAVNEKLADAYIGDIAITTLFIKQYNLNNLKVSNFPHYEPEEQSIVCRKDWPEFISLFNKVLKSIPEPLHVKIKRKYLPFMDEVSKPITMELNQEEKAYIAKNPYIKVSNELGWQPYDYFEEGRAQGFSVEYVKLLAQKIGLHINFVSDTWPNLFEKFKRKEIDMVQPIMPTPQRRAEFLFSDKFIAMQLSLIAQSKRTEISSLESLKGKTVGAGKGWASTAYLKEQYPDITVIEYASTQEMLEAIAFGLIDAGVDDIFTAQYFIDKEMLSNLHVVTAVELTKLVDKNLYLVFHQESKILHKLFNKALNSVSEEELRTIKAKFARTIPLKNNLDVLTMSEQAYMAAKKEIKMCIDPDWMPLEMNEGGTHVGMAADYMKIIEKFIGIPITVVQTKTWLESLDFAKERKCDIFSLAMPTPERRAYMNFTKPYLSIPIVVVSKLDKVFYNTIEALGDKPIGLTKGYAYGEILKVRYPNLNFIDVSSEAEGLKYVQEGKLFAMIGPLATMVYQIQKEYFGSLKIVGKFDEKWELGVGTRNDEPLLLPIFEKAIDAIDRQESQKILNKWISVNYEKDVDYTFMYKLLATASVLFLIVLYRQYNLKKYNAQLEILSNTDKLTGIYNRLKLDDILEYEKKQFDRFERPLSIIMFDLDFFKKVNDNYGHKAGDETLKMIAAIVMANKRDTDVFGRWGGEEFLLVCRETTANGARALAEKLRVAIETQEFPIIVSLTASFGVAQFEKYESIVKVFDKADHALYEAKASGRNKVV